MDDLIIIGFMIAYLLGLFTPKLLAVAGYSRPKRKTKKSKNFRKTEKD